MMNDISPRARRRARIIAMQALYQHALSGNSLDTIFAESRLANEHYKTDWIFCETLIRSTQNALPELDEALTPLMQTPIDKTNPVEMALLRLGAFELKYSLEIPYAVIIDEYVSIASEFGATKGDRFINGVLDALSKQTRPLETQGQVLKQNIQPKPKSIQTNTPRKSRI